MKGIVSKKEDLIYFFKKNKFKRIFLICGNNSFKNSGAKKFFSSILKNLIVKYYFKKSFFPEIRELKIIIKQIKKYKPDLILAIGGGSIIDYAKISNLIEIKDNLEQLIKNYSYPYKKKKYKTFSNSYYSRIWRGGNIKCCYIYK
jgi:alcohol dehydrogenase class IV